ncbi:Sec24 [Hexamita inflata]|uniref:Sec24 n=1 Tax=Hexamita inflata TaxID=28002 RepID=A0AA86Q7X6_9EUKA|nr:Sec24 [Hexamita inflata]
MAQQLPSPVAYFSNRHGSVQKQMSMHSDISSVLPNELFQMQSQNFSASSAFPTCTSLPRTGRLQKELKLPLFVNFQPFGEQCELVERAPVRCKRCKAYLNKFNKLLPTEYTCCICGRVNELPDHFKQEVDGQLGMLKAGAQVPELQHNQVEYVVEDLQYLPASVDQAGLQKDLLSPAEVSHVQANVYSYPTVKQSIPVQPNRIYESGKNIQIPTSKRMDEKQLPVEFNFENIQNSVQKIDFKLRFMQIVIIPVTFNTVYQGVLQEAISVIQQNVEAGAQIIPVFYVNSAIVFDKNMTMYELVMDPQTGEAMLPLPADQLIYNPEHTQKILKLFYSMSKLFESQVFKLGEVLAGCVSSLQRIGGQITLILSDRINSGLGKSLPDDRRSYELTNSTNLQTCTEKELFNYDSFFTRLAEEAAAHNVAVNVIALPFNYCNLSLTQLAPLCVKTSGTMLYNKPAYYVQNIQKTGNALFISNSLAYILQVQALHVTSTIRSSQGVNLNVFEDQIKLNQQFSTKDEFYGSFQKISDVEFSFGQLLNKQTVSVGFSINQIETESAYIQLAVLYTNRSGKRIVRINTVQFKVDNQPASVFNSSNTFGIISYLMRKSSMNYLQAQEIVNVQLQNITKKPVCSQNMQSSFNETQKDKRLIVEEDNRTGNLSEKDIKELLGQIHGNSVQNDGQQKLQAQYEGFKALYEQFVGIMAAFKTECGQKGQSRLLVPQTLQLLPLYISACARTAIFHPHRQKLEGGAFTADQRTAEAMFYIQAPVLDASVALYNNIYNLSDMIEKQTQGLPCAYQCNSMWLKDTYKTVYAICSPLGFYVIVGKNTPIEILKELFGAEINSYDDVKLIESTNSLYHPQCDKILKEMKKLHGYRGSFYITTAESVLEEQAKWSLVEDAMQKDKSYYDFLGQIQMDVAAK